jgi:hypothetical protein
MNNNGKFGNLILDFNSLKFKRLPIEDLGFFKGSFQDKTYFLYVKWQLPPYKVT